jgi:ADP-heptose:LPS heptosyltransferase
VFRPPCSVLRVPSPVFRPPWSVLRGPSPVSRLPCSVFSLYLCLMKEKDRPKVLVIRFSSIGDIVLTSPVTRCLHLQKEAEVHFLTKAVFAPLVEHSPHIAKVHRIDKNIGEVLSELKKERFDWIVDLHRNLRSRQVKWGLWGIPAYSFDKINLQKWLLVNLKRNFLPRLHIVDRYLATVSSLGVRNDGRGLDFFLPEEEDKALAEFRKSAGIDRFPAYVALVVGAAHATKRLPPERLAEVCRGIDYPIVLLGGPGDRDASARIIELSGKPLVDTCGKLSILQSAQLIRDASVVITHDTGLMHIAAAFHKPILSVWGNTIPEFGMYPYYPEGQDKNQSFEVSGLSCRPCSKIGFQKCPKGHFHCMEQQDTTVLLEAVHKVLSAGMG